METNINEGRIYDSETLALRIVAKEQGLSQREMADICKVSHVSISRMLKGDQRVTVDVIKALCFAFGYLPEFFLRQGSLTFAFQPENQKPLTKRKKDTPSEIDSLKLDLEIMTAKYNLLEGKVKDMEGRIQVLFDRLP